MASYSQKTLKGEFGELELETPRDRKASFDPKIVAKGQTRWAGFDDKIISMYTRGMTTREIQGHLEEMYGIEVSPTLISNVTDAVIEEVKAWELDQPGMKTQKSVDTKRHECLSAG